MIDLSQHPELYVRQEIEHLEVFTGFETSNRYSIRTPSGEQLLYAFEESGLLGRSFLSSHRPLTIHVVDRNNTEVINASRSFFWFHSHLHVSDGAGQRIGSMQRRFSFLTRKFDLMDATGRVVAEMRGPIFRPFTFMVYQQGQEIGRVTKQWSGYRPGGLHRRRHLQGRSGHQPDGSGLLTAHAGERDFDRSRLL